MQHRSLWQLLSALDAGERAHFGRWLAAELADTQQYVQQAYQYLAQQTQAPAPAQLWAALYPDRPLDDARLRKLMRDLSRWLETYLAIEAFRDDAEIRDLYLLRALRRRQQPDLFRRLLRRVQAEQAQRPDRSGAYCRQQFLLATEWQRYQLTYAPQEPLDPAPLQASLEGWWLHERLELACLAAARARRLGQSLSAADPLIAYARSQAQSRDLPALRLYLAVYDLLSGTAPEPEAAAVRQRLQDTAAAIRRGEQRNLLNLLLNYHIGALHAQGQSPHAGEILSLYQWGLETGLILRDGHLASDQYKNIITICLRLRQPEQAWTYLHDLRQYLPPALREEAYLFNLGQYYFAEGRFAEVIATYRDQRFGLPLYDVQARAYLLQAHYEREGPGQEWLISQAESAVRYVRQQALPAAHRRGYGHFFRLLRRLMTAHTAARLHKLQAAVAETQPLPHRSWLATQVGRRLG